MAVVLGKGRNEELGASEPALRGFHVNPHSALPLLDRHPACLQSGALIADLHGSLSTLPLFRGALGNTKQIIPLPCKDLGTVTEIHRQIIATDKTRQLAVEHD